MHIPLQEHWSPELLSELQRAVPVLESGSFALGGGGEAGGGGGDAGPPTRGRRQAGRESSSTPQGSEGLRSGHGGAMLSDWAGDATGGGLVGSRDGGSERQAAPADLLSEDAMALPMSTLTSGKRKTFPNRSTFQAHVSCIMDPLQVPRVLQTLRAGPQFKSVRSWSYAYRIVSPFDGETREGSGEDDDPGAGEKMLGLLTRMGLENLLLVMSRWDSGAPERLGAELFRCVSEQCKELLRELQQAVRASFPPEELLAARGQDGAGDARHTESASLEDSSSGGSLRSDITSLPCALDLRALGPTPPARRAAGAVAPSQPRRRLPPVPASARRGAGDAAAAPPEGLEVQRCSIECRPAPAAAAAPADAGAVARRAMCRRGDGGGDDEVQRCYIECRPAPAAAAVPADAGAVARRAMCRRGGTANKVSVAPVFLEDLGSAPPRGSSAEVARVVREEGPSASEWALKAKGTEELLDLVARLRGDRLKLDASLQESADCSGMLQAIDAREREISSRREPGGAAP